MEPLTTYGLIVNFAVLIMMPIIIWGNLRQSGRTAPINAYLWSEHPNFMRVSLLILGMLILFSAITLLGHFGVLAGGIVEIASMVIGIPFLVLAILEIVLAAKAAFKFLRNRKAGTSRV